MTTKNFMGFIPVKRIGLKDLFDFEKSFVNLLAIAVTIVLLVMFFVGVGNYLLHGHHVFNVTREHPWGLLIATYVFFVVSSTGLCIVGSLGDVFKFEALNYQLFSKRAIFGSIVTILAGFAVIAFEIGHPVRMMIYNVISPGLTSAIWWMGTLYGLYLTFMIIEFIFLLRHEMRKAQIFGFIGLAVGLAAHSNLGSVFGFLNARPISNGVYYPTYFILTAFITGIFIAFIMMGFRYKLRFPDPIKKMLVGLAKIQGFLLGAFLFFAGWKMLTDLYGGMPGRADVAMHIFHSWTFWAELVLAIFIPGLVVLLGRAQAHVAMFYASIIGMAGVFFMRYNLVHDTQLKPLQMMKTARYQLPPQWVEYIPSTTEILISLGGLGLAFVMYYLGTRLFDLDENTTEEVPGA